MNYQIAVMPYLNNRAYFYHTFLDNCELVPLTPRKSVKALKAGRVQAGVVPVAGLEQLGDQFELLGNFGIASDGGPVKSVLFLSQIPFESFTSANTIRLSSESVTSNNLLKLLFGYQGGFGNLPKLTNEFNSYDGDLVIGDRALARLSEEDCYVTDLASKWTQYRQLPFVFARWVINRDESATVRAQLEEWLSAFVENEVNLRAITAEHEAHHYGMTSVQIEDYLRGIITWTGKREREGQRRYLSDLKKYQINFSQFEQNESLQYA